MERNGGPGLTVRWPRRGIFLTLYCQEPGSALQTEDAHTMFDTCALMCNLAASERGNVF